VKESRTRSSERTAKGTFDFEYEFSRLNRAVSGDETIKIRDGEIERMRARLSGDYDSATLAADIVRRANERLTPGKRPRPGWVPLHLLGKNHESATRKRGDRASLRVARSLFGAGCSLALKAHRVPVAASDPGLARSADSAGL
jgi:hypothetical protein